ncbi:DUF397 domain-containing protein [Actinomadura luteofluorescens]|uniref:DUF397 domain-containing protein n=1 Tax=Actinomadura luteofluorescens TaxID=46163 RepID=UPI003476555D
MSSHSEAGGNCIEAGRSDFRTIGIRDTKARGTGPVLELTRSEWGSLLDAIRTGSIGRS